MTASLRVLSVYGAGYFMTWAGATWRAAFVWPQPIGGVVQWREGCGCYHASSEVCHNIRHFQMIKCQVYGVIAHDGCRREYRHAPSSIDHPMMLEHEYRECIQTCKQVRISSQAHPDSVLFRPNTCFARHTSYWLACAVHAAATVHMTVQRPNWFLALALQQESPTHRWHVDAVVLLEVQGSSLERASLSSLPLSLVVTLRRDINNLSYKIVSTGTSSNRSLFWQVHFMVCLSFRLSSQANHVTNCTKISIRNGFKSCILSFRSDQTHKSCDLSHGVVL